MINRTISAGLAVFPELEVMADFLTSDAVKVSLGMGTIIDDWGGDRQMRARVRLAAPQ